LKLYHKNEWGVEVELQKLPFLHDCDDEYYAFAKAKIKQDYLKLLCVIQLKVF
jgi:hypothetical protein